jgi:RNA polymerase sigma-70 factor (ECF subfamily)
MAGEWVIQLANEYAIARPAQPISKVAEFESLVRRYQNSVYNIALRMSGNPEEARDLTQEAFVRAYRAFDSYKRGTSFDKWLYRIVTNLCIDELRRRKRRPYIESLDQRIMTSDGDELDREIPDMSHNPEIVYDREHLDECLQDALESINPEYRMAVVLCDIEGFSYEEIAQMMGTSIGTVRSRIHRGRRALRERVSPCLKERSQEVSQK